MAIRKFNPSDSFIPIVKPDYLAESEDCYRLVCLTDRDLHVIRRGLMSFYWRTRYGYWVNRDIWQMEDNQVLVEHLRELEVKMSGCNDLGSDIKAGFLALADSVKLLAQSQCCEQTDVIVNVNGGVNGQLSDGSVTYGIEPYSEVPETTPSGYEDGEQYEAQKCAMAHAMVSDVVYVLSVLSGASSVSAIGALVVAVLGILTIISVPQVAIPALISAVAIAFLASGTLYQVSLEVEAHRSDIVCALLLNDNLDLIMESLADIFDVIIASVGTSSPVGAAIKTILLIFFNSSTVNKLYASYAGFMYPEADCSGCGEVNCGDAGTVQHFPVFSPVEVGSFSVDGDEITINGVTELEGFGYLYSVWFGGTWESPPYNARPLVEIVSVSPTLSGDPEGGYITLFDAGGDAINGAESLGSSDLAAFNAVIANNPVCASILSVQYAPSPVTMVLRFESEQ